MTPVVLYLSMIASSPSHVAKFDGIRRYCALRGWEAVPVPRDEISRKTLPGILRRHGPVGCVVDGIARHVELPPRLFRGLPVSYIGYPSVLTGDRPNFSFDPAAIAAAAMRELSAGMPPCYAVVGSRTPAKWSLNRVNAFRNVVKAAGAECLSFPDGRCAEGESTDGFIERLARWLAALPDRCAVFAVSDEVAVQVVRAARAAKRPVPRSLTLLSVDNFPELCERADPPISSIQLDFELQGFAAARAIGDDLSRRTAQRAPGQGDRHTLFGPLLTVHRKSTSGHGRHETWILEAVAVIRREACEGLTAASLIQRFPVSKSLFNLRFREAVGHSVHDEILHVRLEAACSLLSQTKTAVGAIPGLCGFQCDSTLDRLFRRRFKMGMREWRKRNARPF